ncbi:unnamed protein product [Miscanthus lutarioriparius]|uniref:Uncharacterized protein n=1 Tax=Miscanthus lutarioriparius TaxID=422564 RepID=A0A811SEY8_9POAL|nr:unnamed protein product [Miscanthus lutarioriparius]CAD6341348.1 unnamed protein product [Miscanthus lutarioriparius]
MASTKQLVPVLAVLVSFHLLVWCSAAARHHAKPDPPCGSGADDNSESVPAGMHHKGGHPSCSSPAVSKRGTPAVMTVNGFQKGESGGGPAACDGQYHSDHDMVVALSTGWYAGGRRCHKLIRITSTRTGRTVEAKVVDECDSTHGCRRNIVDTSPAVWKALGLDTNVGVVPVTWSDV